MSARLGFVGVGGIGSRHLKNLRAIDRGTVVAITDLDEETAREEAEPHDAAVYTDHAEMYAEADLDAVFVCVPPFAHGDPELDALDHGYDLFVEKPLALERETAREIRAAIDDDTVTQVGHMERYAEITERAVDHLGDRSIAAIDVRYLFVGVPGAPWWGTHEQSGGQIVEQATHLYDLVRHFGGEVETVRGCGDHAFVDGIDFADASTVSMAHQEGISHALTSCATASEPEVSVRIIAEDCSLTLDYVDRTLTGHVDGEAVRFESDSNRFQRELEGFVDAVEAGDPDAPRSPYSDAYRTFELTLTADEAVRGEGPRAVGRDDADAIGVDR